MGRNVTVIGVFKKEGSDILDNSDDKIILLPLNFAKNVLDVQNDSYQPQIVVRGKNGVSVDEVESELRGLMRSIRRLKPGEEDDFALNNTTIITNQLNVVFGVLNVVGWILGGFSILVGGVRHSQYNVCISERTDKYYWHPEIIGSQKLFYFTSIFNRGRISLCNGRRNRYIIGFWRYVFS